ncbi:MAG: GTP cyclohydrolase II [Micrococcaceae bacterium]
MKKSDKVKVPTPYGVFDMQAYHDTYLDTDHVVVSSEVPKGEVPIVRLHSECITGDIFGSHRCDCGEQLHESLKLIDKKGGYLVYLRGHEGRGIGVLNKLNAYKLQDEGVDTLDANLQLGFKADQRDYTGALDILRDLGIKKLQLLSNNPSKADFLVNHGIEVANILSVEISPTEQNLDYLTTKKNRMSHNLKLDGKTHISQGEK